MREITIREFLRSPKSFLPPPIEGLRVTRRDGIPFYLYPTNMEMSDKKEPLSDKISTMPTEEGWCQLHFEKGVKYPLMEISWEDENGIAVFSKKWACPKCVARYENIGRGKVFYGENKT